jgi:hypothetical protein
VLLDLRDLLVDDRQVAQVPGGGPSGTSGGLDVGDCRVRRVDVVVGSHDGRAFCGQLTGDRAAEPASGAEYEGGLALDSEVHMFVSFLARSLVE